MPTIIRAINQSSDSTPDWNELENQFQHPRTDCGYFQLGKLKNFLISHFKRKRVLFDTADFFLIL